MNLNTLPWSAQLVPNPFPLSNHFPRCSSINYQGLTKIFLGKGLETQTISWKIWQW